MQFRAALQGDNFNGIVAYSSFINPCIEACGMGYMESLYEKIEDLDPFSEERDAFATSILGGSMQISFDGEGRAVIPEALLKEAGIDGKCVFVGKGATFEIWNPDLYEEYAAKSRAIAKEKRLSLRTKRD